ncbi:hypothetical protein D3C86_1107890 [compost metagenome]
MHVQYFHVSSLFAKPGRFVGMIPYRPGMLYSIVAATGIGFRKQQYDLVKIQDTTAVKQTPSQTELQATSSLAGNGLLIRYP